MSGDAWLYVALAFFCGVYVLFVVVSLVHELRQPARSARELLDAREGSGTFRSRVHVAGEVSDEGEQRCVVCAFVLTEGARTDTNPDGLRPWEAGGLVLVAGGAPGQPRFTRAVREAVVPLCNEGD